MTEGKPAPSAEDFIIDQAKKEVIEYLRSELDASVVHAGDYAVQHGMPEDVRQMFWFYLGAAAMVVHKSINSLDGELDLPLRRLAKQSQE